MGHNGPPPIAPLKPLHRLLIQWCIYIVVLAVWDLVLVTFAVGARQLVNEVVSIIGKP